MDYYKKFDEPAVYRAVREVVMPEPAYSTVSPYTTKNQQTTRNQKPFLQYVEDLTFLDRFVMLNVKDVTELDAMFAAVIVFIGNLGPKNFTVDAQSKSIVGFLFEGPRFVNYKLDLFSHRAQFGLKGQRLEGDATILMPFWKDLLQTLEGESFMLTEEDVLEEEDDMDLDDFFLEEDTPMLDLNKTKYLQLEEEPEVVEGFLEDLQDPNFVLQTLLLLAFNCESVANMTLLADKYAQHLFDSTIACMAMTMCQVTLPMARCAAVLMDHILKTTDVSVSEAQQTAILDTLNMWTHKDRSARGVCVKTSEEVAILISANLERIQQLSKATINTNTLRTIANNTEFDHVRTTLGHMIQ